MSTNTTFKMSDPIHQRDNTQSTLVSLKYIFYFNSHFYTSIVIVTHEPFAFTPRERGKYSQSRVCHVMSQVITLRFSFASIMLDRKRDSTWRVGELVSSFDLYSRCFLLSAHPHPFTLPHRFSFKNMRYFKVLCFSCRERVLASRGCITFQKMSCWSSFINASAPFCPNCHSSFLADICSVRKL